jgi:hypothetical protein
VGRGRRKLGWTSSSKPAAARCSWTKSATLSLHPKSKVLRAIEEPLPSGVQNCGRERAGGVYTAVARDAKMEILVKGAGGVRTELA